MNLLGVLLIFFPQIISSFKGDFPLYVVFSGSALFSSILFRVSSYINISILIFLTFVTYL